MPVFSEIFLRFAFRNIFGKYRRINASELDMYRKLLLFYYAEDYQDVEVLTQIMTCFDQDKIHEIIEESEAVMEDWKSFVEHELMPDALTQTFKLIIQEWSKRYKVKNGEISFDLLKAKAAELQQMLNYNECFIERFIKKRRNKLIYPTLDAQSLKAKWTENDITFVKIISDLLYKISPLVRNKVRSLVGKQPAVVDLDEVAEEVPPTKRAKVESPKVEQREEAIKPKIQQTEIIKKDTQMPINEHESSSDEIFEIMEILSSDEEQDQTPTEIAIPASQPASPSKTPPPPTPTTTTTTAVAVEDTDEVQFVTKIITLSTALSHITEVHAFALVNGYNDVSELMQRVTEVLRTKEAD